MSVCECVLRNLISCQSKHYCNMADKTTSLYNLGEINQRCRNIRHNRSRGHFNKHPLSSLLPYWNDKTTKTTVYLISRVNNSPLFTLVNIHINTKSQPRINSLAFQYKQKNPTPLVQGSTVTCGTNVLFLVAKVSNEKCYTVCQWLECLQYKYHLSQHCDIIYPLSKPSPEMNPT